MSYDIKTQANLIEQEQKKLLAECEQAQADILSDILEEKDKMHIKVRISMQEFISEQSSKKESKLSSGAPITLNYTLQNI